MKGAVNQAGATSRNARKLFERSVGSRIARRIARRTAWRTVKRTAKSTRASTRAGTSVRTSVSVRTGADDGRVAETVGRA